VHRRRACGGGRLAVLLRLPGGRPTCSTNAQREHQLTARRSLALPRPHADRGKWTRIIPSACRGLRASDSIAPPPPVITRRSKGSPKGIGDPSALQASALGRRQRGEIRTQHVRSWEHPTETIMVVRRRADARCREPQDAPVRQVTCDRADPPGERLRQSAGRASSRSPQHEPATPAPTRCRSDVARRRHLRLRKRTRCTSSLTARIMSGKPCHRERSENAT
jgi:hypothetical protein